MSGTEPRDDRAPGADESAFPTGPTTGTYGHEFRHDGLTKRELLAAMAAQGLAAIFPQGGDFMATHIAQGAVEIADALLRELAK